QRATFVRYDVGRVTGDIKDRAGALGLQLFDFFYVSGNFDFTTVHGDLVRNDGTTYSNVDYRVLSGNGADAFVGKGPPSDPLAVGLTLKGFDFSLVLFAAGAKAGNPVV